MGEHSADFSENDLIKVIDEIPGKSLMDKILGSISVTVYVHLKCGVDRETFLKMAAHVYDALSGSIKPFKDLEVDYNQSIQNLELKTLQNIDPSSPRHTNSRLKSSASSLTEEDFK